MKKILVFILLLVVAGYFAWQFYTNISGHYIYYQGHSQLRTTDVRQPHRLARQSSRYWISNRYKQVQDYQFYSLDLNLQQKNNTYFGTLDIHIPGHRYRLYLQDYHGHQQRSFVLEFTNSGSIDLSDTPNIKAVPDQIYHVFLKHLPEQPKLSFEITTSPNLLLETVFGFCPIPPTLNFVKFTSETESIVFEEFKFSFIQNEFKQLYQKVERREFPSAQSQFDGLDTIGALFDPVFVDKYTKLEVYQNTLLGQVRDAERAISRLKRKQSPSLKDVKKVIKRFHQIRDFVPDPWVLATLESLYAQADAIFYANEYAKWKARLYAQFKRAVDKKALIYWDRYALNSFLNAFLNYYNEKKDSQVADTIQTLQFYLERLSVEAFWAKNRKKALLDYIRLYYQSKLFRSKIDAHLKTFVKENIVVKKPQISRNNKLFYKDYRVHYEWQLKTPFPVYMVHFLVTLTDSSGRHQRSFDRFFWRNQPKSTLSEEVIFEKLPLLKNPKVTVKIGKIVPFEIEPNYQLIADRIEKTLPKSKWKKKKKYWTQTR